MPKNLRKSGPESADCREASIAPQADVLGEQEPVWCGLQMLREAESKMRPDPWDLVVLPELWFRHIPLTLSIRLLEFFSWVSVSYKQDSLDRNINLQACIAHQTLSAFLVPDVVLAK